MRTSIVNARCSRAHSRRGRGFTIIELMVVIGIIVLLAALMFAYSGRLRERARKASCKRLLESIATALESYKVDFRQYPPSTFGAYTGDEALTYFLTTAFRYNPNASKAEVYASINAGPYLQVQPSDLVDKSGGAGRLSLVDPWQTQIYYNLVQQKNASVWDTTGNVKEYISIPVIYSCGPNKVSETTVNATTGAITQAAVCDDITLDTHN